MFCSVILGWRSHHGMMQINLQEATIFFQHPAKMGGVQILRRDCLMAPTIPIHCSLQRVRRDGEPIKVPRRDGFFGCGRHPLQSRWAVQQLRFGLPWGPGLSNAALLRGLLPREKRVAKRNATHILRGQRAGHGWWRSDFGRLPWGLRLEPPSSDVQIRSHPNVYDWWTRPQSLELQLETC